MHKPWRSKDASGAKARARSRSPKSRAGTGLARCVLHAPISKTAGVQDAPLQHPAKAPRRMATASAVPRISNADLRDRRLAGMAAHVGGLGNDHRCGCYADLARSRGTRRRPILNLPVILLDDAGPSRHTCAGGLSYDVAGQNGGALNVLRLAKA